MCDKHIPTVVQPRLPSITRTFLSCQNEALSLLSTNSHPLERRPDLSLQGLWLGLRIKLTADRTQGAQTYSIPGRPHKEMKPKGAAPVLHAGLGRGRADRRQPWQPKAGKPLHQLVYRSCSRGHVLPLGVLSPTFQEEKAFSAPFCHTPAVFQSPLPHAKAAFWGKVCLNLPQPRHSQSTSVSGFDPPGPSCKWGHAVLVTGSLHWAGCPQGPSTFHRRQSLSIVDGPRLPVHPSAGA